MNGRRTPYPLAALEAARRRALDSAREEHSAAVADAERARASADGAAGTLDEAVKKRRAEEESRGDSVTALDARCRWLARLRADERLLRAEVERRLEVAALAAAEVWRRRERLLEAERHLRVVERHREEWERARRRAALRAEEAADEERARSTQRRT